jgi:hypothetical protein
MLAALVLAATTAAAGTLTLSPAAVPLKGRFGQSTTQSLTLTNATEIPMDFVLEAKDVVVRDGSRQFMAPGELPDSIAVSAVFSEKAVTVPPGESRTVEVRLTLPEAARHRAVVCVFRGVTRIGNTIPSIGALLTFTMSEDVALSPEALLVRPQTHATNVAFEQPLANAGQEPLVPKGVAAILDGRGALVGRARFEARRLLPGERVTVRAEYPGELPPGAYRALATFEYEGRTATREAAFLVR